MPRGNWGKALTAFFLIKAPGALHFSNRGHLFESNFETENPYKIVINIRNYHKRMNYELIHDLVLSFSVITNPVSMGERLQHEVAWILADILLLFKTFCLLGQGHLIGTTCYVLLCVVISKQAPQISYPTLI